MPNGIDSRGLLSADYAESGPIANDWKANTEYSANQLVLYNGTLYRALAAFTSGGSFVSANWTLVSNGSYMSKGVGSPIPLSRRVWAAGDSTTDNGNAGSNQAGGRLNGLVLFGPRSYLGAALLNLDGRVSYGGVAATPGYTSAQILATHVPTIVANANPGDLCVVLAGTNDAPATALATTIANLTSIYTQLDAAGIIPVCCTITPNKNPAQYVAFIQAFNAWVRDYARQHGYPVADFYATTVDPSTESYIAVYDSGDNTHPSDAGAWAMGVELARAITTRVPAIVRSSLFHTQSYPGALTAPANAVILTDTNADGVPDEWGTLAAAGTSTAALGVDTFVTGKVFTLTRGDTDRLQRGFGSGCVLTAGHRTIVGGKLKVPTVPAGGQWSLVLTNKAGNGLMVGFLNMTQPVPNWSRFIFDLIVPSGWPTYDFGLDYYVLAQPGVVTSLGQATVRDLTAEGVA